MSQWFKYLPINLFASTMGMAGLSIAFLRYSLLFSPSHTIGVGLLGLAYVMFVSISVAYSLKFLQHREEVITEFNHPIKANFFSAIAISLLLIAAATTEFQPAAARTLWILGSLLQLLLTIIIISRWITRSYEIAHSNPTWFIPVVGNIIVPIAGVEFADKEILWFFFSIGLFFWLSLFTIVFYRIIFHPQLAQKFIPTLFILIAPPAVGFTSYLKLTGSLDVAARILLYIALFFVLLLLAMVRHFSQLTFTVSWWAYTFPLCAVTIAAINASIVLSSGVLAAIAGGLLLISTLVVGIVFFKTMKALYEKKLFEAEEESGKPPGNPSAQGIHPR